MPTVFENISDGFYTAFFEPNPEKRKTAIDAWIKTATPIVQLAVENDIRTYLEPILKDTWTPEGWKDRAKKFSGPYELYQKALFVDTYKLYLDVKLRPRNPREKEVIVGALSPEIRAKTLEAARKALPELKPTEDRKVVMVSSVRTVNGDDDTDDYDDGGRSPNDDRSDSMNPNNDAYQASMDNRSDQMNPNNDAYWSSRGR